MFLLLWQVVFEAKVVYLATLLVELVLPEVKYSVVGATALILNLDWVHHALRIHDQVNQLALPLQFEL